MIHRWFAQVVAPILVLAAGVAVWQWRVEAEDTPSWFLPSPHLIGRTLIDDRGMLADHAWVTLREVLIGFAIALVAGILIAVLIHISPILERAIYPIVIASQRRSPSRSLSSITGAASGVRTAIPSTSMGIMRGTSFC